MISPITFDLLSGTTKPGILFFKDRLRIKVGEKTTSIAIKILPENTKKEDVKSSSNWVFAQLDGKTILINSASLYKRLHRIEIKDQLIDKSIQNIASCSWQLLSSWKLFSNSSFSIKNLSLTELDHIKKTILITYSIWEKSKHLPRKQHGLARTISFIGEKAYILLNKNIDGKISGRTKVVSSAVGADDGVIYASASFSLQRAREENESITKQAFQEKVIKEKTITDLFKGDDRFVQILDFIEYVDKKGLYKARIIMPKYIIDLFDALQKLNDAELTDLDRIDISYQIIDIVNAVHEKGWLLRDLKEENFLLYKKNNRWKVVCCDLEMFCKNDDKDQYKKIQGTLHILSPEFILGTRNNTQQATKKTDMWALGVALCNVLQINLREITNLRATITLPFTEKLHKDMRELSTTWLKEPQDKNGIEHLVWEMLQPDPDKRISIESALNFMNTYFPPFLEEQAL